MRLIPSNGDSRRVFYNLYYKKDSLGKVSQMIIKFKPTSASIKSGYSFFEGEHEIISTEPISQGLIKSNSVNLNIKKNDVELMCVEIAFDRPCSNNYVHYENGPGPWCQVEGSYKFTIRDCWSSGSTSSMASFGQSINATGNGSSGTVFVSPSSLNDIVLCESEEGDNFILSLHQTYLTWIQSSTANLNSFNQIVGGICGNLSNDNKVEILKKLKIVKEANISIQEYNNWFEGVTEGYDGEAIDPNDLEYETPLTQEQLPSLNDWLSHFPKISNTVQMDAGSVFNLIGGDLLLARNTNLSNFRNACAIRGSRGLLYSGVSIPILKYGNPPKQATMKGSDNKNYILSALNFNKFMIDKFGDTPDKLIGSDANDPVKVANFLKGKNGIYVIVNAQPGNAGYTGHVDAIINGRCISDAYANPNGGVSSIRVWQLN